MIKVTRYYPKSNLMKGIVEYYQLIKVDTPCLIQTIPNGRVDAWVTNDGGFEFCNNKHSFVESPKSGFFPLTGTNTTIRVVHKLSCINIKFLPHILHFKALQKLISKGEALSFEFLFGENNALKFEQKIKEAKTTHARLKQIEVFFESCFFNEIDMDMFTQKIINEMGNDDFGNSIIQLSKEAHVSVKTLERKFKKTIGINPKTFQRILRFQNAIREIKKSNTAISYKNLSLSLANGYFDQSHFIKDSRLLTGLPPKKLLLQFVPTVTDIVLVNQTFKS
jgi:AraC-like DNA-binding protein